MTIREQLNVAAFDRLNGVDGLPLPLRGDDDPRTGQYVEVVSGYADLTHFLALLDEGCAPRADCPPIMGAGGVVYDWNLKLVASYSVRTEDAEARKAQRDVGIGLITAALLPSPNACDRRLGGLANWMWIEPADLHNDVYDGDIQLGVARIPLTIWFSANDPSA